MMTDQEKLLQAKVGERFVDPSGGIWECTDELTRTDGNRVTLGWKHVGQIAKQPWIVLRYEDADPDGGSSGEVKEIYGPFINQHAAEQYGLLMAGTHGWDWDAAEVSAP